MNGVRVLRNSIRFLILTSLAFLPSVRSHGYLIEPVNRGSLWRLKIPGAVVDPNDHLHTCGGFQKQWNFNGGNCGPCGDDYSLPRPRPYENMGINSRGIVVRTYEEGATISVSVIIKKNRKGFFLFNICKLRRDDSIEDEKCFDKHSLRFASGRYRYNLDSWNSGNYTMRLELPAGLTCDRCVLRWHYTAGNSWGKCSDGTEDLGCGPQETYRTCSDISILPKEHTDPKSMKLPVLPGFGHRLANTQGIPSDLTSLYRGSFDEKHYHDQRKYEKERH